MHRLHRSIAAAVLLAMASLLIAPLAAQETVRVAPIAPYAEIDDAGRWSGPAIDLMRAAADRAGTDIAFVEATPEGLTQAGAGAALPVFATPETPPGMVRSLPLARDSIGLLGAGGGAGFLGKMLGLFNWGFAQVALVLSGILFVVGTIFWTAERGHNKGIDGDSGDNGPLRGIGNGFWWAGVTATTIGYGDTVPETVPGRVVAMVWMLFSMALTALLTAYLVSLTGGGTIGAELADEIEDRRVAIVGGNAAGGSALIPAELLIPAASVRSYPTLNEARQALASEAVDVVAHPYRALQKRTDGTGVTRTNAETLLPVVLVDEGNPALRREIDRIVLSTNWQGRMDNDR